MLPADGGIAIGTILSGKYRVEGIVGRGGMGMVYRAHHVALNEPVAMKVLRADALGDEEAVARFLREAQLAVKLRSEHVARIHDVGTSNEGSPYIAMEYLEGADLGQLVEQNGALFMPIAVDLVLQACDAIAEAHSLGIVHRDIKPTNLYVSFRPDQTAIVKVLDFGISKGGTGTDLSLTQTQSMLGTPAYMSPEQMRSARDVDARTDIWSIGCVLYELVEARRPFDAESFSEMCVMVAVDPPLPMTRSHDLEPVIMRCLQKKPDDRYANVAELMADLAHHANNPDAARYYVTRAHRVLGTGRDSSSAIPRPSRPALGSGPVAPGPHAGAGLVTPPAMPIAALTMHRPFTPYTPRAAVPRRAVWLGALLAILVGVGGAVAYVALSRDAPAPEPARVETPAVVVEPPVAIDAAVAAPSIDAAVVADEPAAVEIAKPPRKRPAIKRPAVKKLEVAKPVVKPPKKCDPFDSRVKC